MEMQAFSTAGLVVLAVAAVVVIGLAALQRLEFRSVFRRRRGEVRRRPGDDGSA